METSTFVSWAKASKEPSVNNSNFNARERASSSNWKKGKRTHVFIDEIHVIFENEESATFFASAWRQFRKRDAYPTGITQNVKYLLSSQQGTSMLSNSEFIVMLNQSPNDREDLAELLKIS